MHILNTQAGLLAYGFRYCLRNCLCLRFFKRALLKACLERIEVGRKISCGHLDGMQTHVLPLSHSTLNVGMD